MSRQKITAALDKTALNPYEFLWDLLLEASLAKKRVTMQTMSLEDDAVGDMILHIFQEIVPRRVKKELYVDWFAKLVGNEYIDVKGSAKQDFLQKFKDVNVHVTLTNPPTLLERILPMLGRDHKKAASVDDRVFYLGGLNLSSGNAESFEFMVKFTGDTARALIAAFDDFRTREYTKDHSYPISDTTTLLVDCGKPNQSLILQTANEILFHAKKYIALTSVYIPDGNIAQTLSDAFARGIDVTIITSPLPSFGKLFPLNIDIFDWAAQQANRAQVKIQNLHFPIRINEHKKTHAKLLIVDDDIALFGSNNLSSKIVAAGTEEVSILTKDKELISNLRKKFLEFKKETKEILL